MKKKFTIGFNLFLFLYSILCWYVYFDRQQNPINAEFPQIEASQQNGIFLLALFCSIISFIVLGITWGNIKEK